MASSAPSKRTAATLSRARRFTKYVWNSSSPVAVQIRVRTRASDIGTRVDCTPKSSGDLRRHLGKRGSLLQAFRAIEMGRQVSVSQLKTRSRRLAAREPPGTGSGRRECPSPAADRPGRPGL